MHFAEGKRVHAHCSPASCRPLIPDTTMCFLMFASFLMRAWTGGLLDHAVYKDDRISGWRLINSLFCAEILDTLRPNARMGRSQKRKFLSGLLISFLHSILVSTCTFACEQNEKQMMWPVLSPSAPQLCRQLLCCCRHVRACAITHHGCSRSCLGLLESSDITSGKRGRDAIICPRPAVYNDKPYSGPF